MQRVINIPVLITVPSLPLYRLFLFSPPFCTISRSARTSTHTQLHTHGAPVARVLPAFYPAREYILQLKKYAYIGVSYLRMTFFICIQPYQLHPFRPAQSSDQSFKYVFL